MKRVVVCGGGMSGLAASAAAAQAGAKVTLVEKGPQAGGSARMSSGFIWTHERLDALHEAIPEGNPLLQALVHEEFEAAVAWLKDLGVRVGAKRRILDYGHGWQVDPEQLCQALLGALGNLGVELRTHTALERLELRDAGVEGIHAISPGGRVGLPADAVVLATGGFQGNAELITRYCVPSAANVYHRANPWSTGDGFLAALAGGAAASAGLESFYGHAMLAPPAQLNPADFAQCTQYQGAFAVALNLDGRRFADETLGTGEEVLNQRLARQREGRGAYVVDARGAARASLPPDLLMTRVTLERARARGALLEAATLEALAAKLADWGIDARQALATLRAYNEALSAPGGAPVPGRSRLREALDQPPFYAVAVKASITFTMGGLATDERLRVLRRAASSSPLARLVRGVEDVRQAPLPGLFAAGCDVGNISNLGYAGGLATALVTGRVAGGEAALRA